MDKDYYKILGITKDAKEDAIKTAYKALALKHHPDKNPDPSSIDKFKEINAAYQILSNKEKRAEYDARKNGTFVQQGFSGFNNGMNQGAMNDHFNMVINMMNRMRQQHGQPNVNFGMGGKNNGPVRIVVMNGHPVNNMFFQQTHYQPTTSFKPTSPLKPTVTPVTPISPSSSNTEGKEKKDKKD